MDQAAHGSIASGASVLNIYSPFEEAKLNVGDYRDLRNVGGLFPIGEVFTEARDLTAVAGEARLFAFADIDYQVNRPKHPITIHIRQGRVEEAENSTPAFDQVLANIRADEGEVWVREIGFGLNRAFGPERLVRDVGTAERMLGVHLSLGAKHAVYPKAGFQRKHTRHHVDVFLLADSVAFDGRVVCKDGIWLVGLVDLAYTVISSPRSKCPPSAFKS